MNAIASKGSSGFALAILLCTVTARPAGVQEEIFKLRETSVFDLDESNFLRGQAAALTETPSPAVKGFPSFQSTKPLYGRVCFGGQDGESDSGTAYHLCRRRERRDWQRL